MKKRMLDFSFHQRLKSAFSPNKSHLLFYNFQ
uniref:Uncharacterized protein n=1 Tax=Rhizophora mucronata TaxID=61149 RepID=A0A2P2QU67_RHIMU